MRTTKS